MRVVPEPFAILLSNGAKVDLSSLTAHAERLILDGLEVQLGCLQSIAIKRHYPSSKLY
jgi:hypothetical protein